MNMKLPTVRENTPQCKLTIMNAGFCTIKKTHILKGSEAKDISIPALFFLIEHPVHGKILFDTGYSTRFFDVTKTFPYSIMKKITPVQITEKENAINQLRAKNITAEQIQTVILSHLHADHVGGIADFKHSTIYVNKEEWEYGQQSKLKLFSKGYLKQLYENMDLSLIRQLDFKETGQSYGPLSNTIDLYNDGSIILIPMPGHSIGQFGLLLNISNEERYFLIADSTYLRENYRQNKGGSIFGRLVHYSYQKYESNFPMLKQLELDNPHLILIPSHDPAMYEQFISNIEH